MTERVAKWFPYLLLISSIFPLLWIDGLLYPFVAPKTLLIRGTALLACAVFAYLALSGKPFFFQRLKNPLTWIPGGLLASAYLSSLLSIDFYHSFWSLFDRGDGLAMLSALIAFFYLTLLIADRLFFERLIRWVTVVTGLVAGIAILQWLQTTTGIPIPFMPHVEGRIGGSLGNAAFLAGYLGLALFVALMAARSIPGKWRRLGYGSAALAFVAILLAATRGTLVALVGVSFLALAYASVRGEGSIRIWSRRGLVAVLLVAGLFIGFRAQIAQIPFEPVSRVASISFADSTVANRLFVWKNVLSEAWARPVLGVGAEHIAILFNRVYDPSQIGEQWFDRTHNSFLDYFVQFGIVGLAFYLALLIAFFVNARRLLRAGDERGGFLILLIVVYAVQDFFVFDTGVTLWLFLVLFAVSFVQKSDTARALAITASAPGLPIVAGALFLVPLWWGVWLPLQANLLLAEGYRYHLVDVRQAVASMKEGLSLGTYADLEYGYQAYSMYTDRQQTRLSGSERVIAYGYARDTLRANFKKYPYDARTATYFAHVLDSTPPEETVNETELRLVIARAILLSPKRAQPRYIFANLDIRKGDAFPKGSEAQEGAYREAIVGLEAYAALVPNYAEPHYVLATLYLLVGDTREATAQAERGLAVYTTDGLVAKRAAKYYVTVQDWPNAERMLSDYVSDRPDDYATLADLAKAAYLAGHKDRALSLVETLREKAPEVLAADPAFLAAITAYEQSKK